mmetsp:Transcript_4304/g.6991  ORF Transcript_4304/g.6991 Transcript_4304/m.6991 type:complete len:551 (+) Transcript_4304:87-1739(+)
MADFETTLADEFLADLDDLEDFDDDANEDKDEDTDTNAVFGTDDDMMDEEAKARKKIQDDIAREFGKTDGDEQGKLKFDSVHDFVKLWNSDDFKAFLEKIKHYSEEAQKREAEENESGTVAAVTTMSEEDPEYQVIVSSNQVLVDIDSETEQIYKFVRDLYASKFPELESLVVHPMDYIRVVKAIGNELDLTQIDLTELLPANTIMVVSVTATTSSGTALAPDQFNKVVEACDVALELDAAKQNILQYVESRMSAIAPNLSALVGTSVAAKLMAAAAGLVSLSKLPASAIIVLGAKKKAAVGLSMDRVSRGGFINECGLMTQTPPDLRVRAGRVISGRTALAARVDAFMQDPTGRIGRGFYDEIEAKINKWQEPPPGKKVKALAAPDSKKKARRAGKRVRRIKESMAVSEMRKQANRMQFGELSDDSYRNKEISLGMLTSGGTGSRLRIRQDERAGRVGGLNKRRQQQQHAGGGVSGFSSLAFTPVQGIELENPVAASERLARSEQGGYFAADANFSFKVPEPVKKKKKTDEKSDVKKETPAVKQEKQND